MSTELQQATGFVQGTTQAESCSACKGEIGYEDVVWRSRQ